MLSYAFHKAILFPKNFSRDYNLHDSGIFLPVFHFRTNLKLNNISLTPKLVKKVITNPDLPMASVPACNPVVVLINLNFHRY